MRAPRPPAAVMEHKQEVVDENQNDESDSKKSILGTLLGAGGIAGEKGLEAADAAL